MMCVRCVRLCVCVCVRARAGAYGEREKFVDTVHKRTWIETKLTAKHEYVSLIV